MTSELIFFVSQEKWEWEYGPDARRKLRQPRAGGMNAMLPLGCWRRSCTFCNRRSPFTYQCHQLILKEERTKSQRKKRRNKDENGALEERHSQFFSGLISSSRFQDNFLGTTERSVGLSTVGFVYCTVFTTKASGKHSKQPTEQPLEQKITGE